MAANSLETLLKSLILPSCVHGLAPLPLPSVPFPASSPTPAIDLKSAGHPILHAALTVSGSLLPFSHTAVLPALNSSYRSCRSLCIASGLPVTWQDVDRGGYEVHDLEAAPVRAWFRVALASLAALRALFIAPPPLALALPSREVEILLHLAPFASYASWTHPALAAEARACLVALQQGGASPSGSSAGGEASISLLVNVHARALLEWARSASAGGAWRAPSAAAVRYVIPWLLSRLTQPSLDGESLGIALPLALRLCDDWEATSVWCGLSSLACLLGTATPTALGPFAPIIHETLLRASAAGAATSHPVIAMLLAHARAYALAVLVGPATPHSSAALAKAAARRGTAVAPGGGSSRSSSAVWDDSGSSAGFPVPLFEGPWDVALAALLRLAATSTSSHVLYAQLHAVPALIAGAGALGCARLLQNSLLPLLKRAALPEQVLCEGGGGSPAWACDARLPAAALHALHVLCLVLMDSVGRLGDGDSAAAAATGSSASAAGSGGKEGGPCFAAPQTLLAILAICVGAAVALHKNTAASFLLPRDGEVGAPPQIPMLPTALEISMAHDLIASRAALAINVLESAWPAVIGPALAELQAKYAAVDAAVKALSQNSAQ